MKPPWDAIVWWEVRRLPFNLVVGLTGLAVVVTVVSVGGRLAPPGEDAVEPLMLVFGSVAYGLAANIFYTLGWATEVLWTAGDTSRTAPLRARIFRLGLALSIALTLLPGVLVLVAWAIFGVH